MTPPRHPEAGLTLIEVLVVLAIIGVMAGVSVLSLGALDRGARAETEAMRLADRMQLASDEALTSNTTLTLVWTARGYRFDRWDAAGAVWRRIDRGPLGVARALPGALRLQRRDGLDPAPVEIAADLPQATTELVIAGVGVAWAVVFDGFSAAGAPLPGG